jgi:aminoglycoside phosphotransferase (APT) family kinase protein
MEPVMKFLLDEDLEKVAAIVSRACPDIDTKNVIFLSSACENRAFKIGDHHVARFPRDQVAYEALCREEIFCCFIKGKFSLMTPDLKVYGADDYPFSLHCFIPGESLTKELYLKLSEDQKDCVAKDLANFFAYFHSIPLEKARNIGALSLYKYKDSKEVLEIIKDKRLDKVRNFSRFIVKKYERISVPDCDYVFSHFDVHSMNMAFNSSSGKLVGIFDFGDCGIGDLHREFFRLNSVSPDLARRTINHYQDRTGRMVDWNRVRIYGAFCQLSLLLEDSITDFFSENIENIEFYRSDLFPEWEG